MGLSALFEKTADAMVFMMEQYPINTKKDVSAQKIELLGVHENLIKRLHKSLFLVEQLQKLIVGLEKRLNLAYQNKVQELDELNNEKE